MFQLVKFFSGQSRGNSVLISVWHIVTSLLRVKSPYIKSLVLIIAQIGKSIKYDSFDISQFLLYSFLFYAIFALRRVFCAIYMAPVSILRFLGSLYVGSREIASNLGFFDTSKDSGIPKILKNYKK